ncbi:MAG: ACT domain-containing protein [Aeromonadaceae bacterium]
MPHSSVSGVLFDRHEASLTLLGLPDRPDVLANVLGPLNELAIPVDMIVQKRVGDGSCDFSFTVARDDYFQAYALMREWSSKLEARELQGQPQLAKLAIVGEDMWEHPGIARRLFVALGGEGIAIERISTSQHKLLLTIDEQFVEPALRVLHQAFALG